MTPDSQSDRWPTCMEKRMSTRNGATVACSVLLSKMTQLTDVLHCAEIMNKSIPGTRPTKMHQSSQEAVKLKRNIEGSVETCFNTSTQHAKNLFKMSIGRHKTTAVNNLTTLSSPETISSVLCPSLYQTLTPLHVLQSQKAPK